MVKLNNIIFDDGGRKISYDYSFDKGVHKFFEKENCYYATYGEDVSNVPYSIAVIPFLSNFITIAWFAGFDIEVEEVDEDFYKAVDLIKIEFAKQHPNYNLRGTLKTNKLVKNKIEGDKSAMLFSGGVDAFATYIRNYGNKPDLITIHGPDIGLDDIEQWNDLKTFIDNEPLLMDNNKNYIESNVRDFYSYHVPLLIDGLGWWGKIQHGLALLGVSAPLSYVKQYNNIAIASSYTKDVDISWGSTPETDEKISWAGIKVIHDGYALRRQDKVDLIADFATRNNQAFRLRVCYSELRDQFNCSNCEKCFRTILGLVLAGQNPNNFGFDVDGRFYESMFKTIGSGSSSKGMNYFWWELSEKAKTTKDPFVFEDAEKERQQIENIANGAINKRLESKLVNRVDGKQRVKFILMNKFASLYGLYKKIRYQGK